MATVAFVDAVISVLRAFELATATAALYELIGADILEFTLKNFVLASGYTS